VGPFFLFFSVVIVLFLFRGCDDADQEFQKGCFTESVRICSVPAVQGVVEARQKRRELETATQQIIYIQSMIRMFLMRRRYKRMQKASVYVLVYTLTLQNPDLL
jgi:hypothetical protein